ncbi:MAG TPA: GGDEF domain-containing protein [Nitrospira sp.]|jgi:diguanylate cyclase (GGDEF)-like protein|nr:GGDEF domain-containing protein [Nitrospira sp.]
MSTSNPSDDAQYDPQVLLNAQPVIMTVIDPTSHQAIFQNHVSLAKFGNISGQKCFEKIVNGSAPCAFCKMPEAVRTGRITASEVPLPNDQYLLVQWAVAPTTDGRMHVVETITDITESKRQQKDVEVLNGKLEAANRNLVVLNHELTERSLRDGLTGLYNHIHFREVLTQMFAQFERSGSPLSLLFVDMDDFKAINDTYGHAIGDQVLRALGRLLDNRESNKEGQPLWRASDVTARYGGEEFAVLLPDTSKEGALVFAERLRRRIMGIQLSPELVSQETPLFPLTASMGVASFPADATTATELLKAADSAMYLAKHAGKNCVKTSARLSDADVASLIG